ncbi:MAG: hypothetical protein PUF61_10965 [Spirochaetales bacterium]|nr:hypothetical protein [Spirochaetales bacterium]
MAKSKNFCEKNIEFSQIFKNLKNGDKSVYNYNECEEILAGKTNCLPGSFSSTANNRCFTIKKNNDGRYELITQNPDDSFSSSDSILFFSNNKKTISVIHCIDGACPYIHGFIFYGVKGLDNK